MDRELLGAFNNLSVALQNLSDNLERASQRTDKSESMISDSLSKFDVTEQIKSIDEGIKKISASNTEIINQQKQIIQALSKKEPTKTAGESEKVTVQKKLTDIVQRIFNKQKEDSQKIKSTNDAVTKQKRGATEFEPDADRKKKITDGVKMILLIAAGVLAIGLALKIVGKVDFASVIALGIAIPLIAIGFKKVAEMRVDLRALATNVAGLLVFSAAILAASFLFSKVRTITVGQALTTILIATSFAALALTIGRLTQSIKNVDLKGLYMMPLVLITASIAIMASSYILGMVRTISLGQAATTVLISIAFAALSLSIGRLTKSIKNVDLRGLVLMPFVLITASIAIVGASYILSAVRPVGFIQLLTSIAIAATFAVLGFGLGKIARGMKGFTLADAAKLPVVLIASSAAILGSSLLLSGVKTISFGQFLTAVGIAIVFIPISFALPFVAKAIKNVDIRQVAMMPLVLVSMALAINLTSQVFATARVISPSKLFSLILQGVAIAVVGVALGFTFFALQKMGLASPGGLKTVLFGGIALLGIATTVWLASKILSAGDYNETSVPSLMWTLGSAAAILAYGVLMAAAGTIIVATGGVVGGLGLLAGAVAILLIAGTIVATDSILSAGDYTKGPSLEYAASVSLLLMGFGAAMALSGALIIPIALGTVSIGLVAEAIRDTSVILSQGTYTGGPTEEWAKGVSLAIGAFAPVIGGLGGGILDSIFGVSSDDIGNSIKVIARAIVDSADVFAGAGANWVMGPPVAWSESVGKAIGAFAPVFGLLQGSGLFGLLDSIKIASMTAGIIAVTTGIIASAGLFAVAGAALSYTSYPSLEWSEGVSKAIGAFAPVFEKLNSSGVASLFDFVKVGSMTAAIVATTTGIITSASMFQVAGLEYKNYPSVEWSEGVSSAIQAFSPAMKWAAENSGLFSADAEDLQETIVAVAAGITSTSLIMAGGKFNIEISPNYFSNIKTAFMSTFDIMKRAEDLDIDIDVVDDLVDVAGGIKRISIEIGGGKYDKVIPMEYGESLVQAYKDFDKIDNIVQDISIFNTFFAVRVAKSIAKISNTIAEGKYDTVIPATYGTNLTSLFAGYKDIVDIVKSITPGFFSNLISQTVTGIESLFGIPRDVITPETVAQNIVNLSNVISTGNYKPIPTNWMQSVYENMKQYLELLDLISGSPFDFEIFGVNFSIGKGISRLTSDYDRLAESIQSVANAVANLDIEKMNSMRAMTGSVVLLSLMDPDQFESMMDALEDKSSVLGDIFSKLEVGVRPQEAIPTVKSAGVVGVEGGKTEMGELINIVKGMAASLGQISSASSNISTYVNEIRGGKPATMKKEG